MTDRYRKALADLVTACHHPNWDDFAAALARAESLLDEQLEVPPVQKKEEADSEAKHEDTPDRP